MDLSDREKTSDVLAAAIAAVTDDATLADYVLAFSGAGAATFDASGRYIDVNARWSELLDIASPENLIGVSHFDVAKSLLSKKEFADMAKGVRVRDQYAQIHSADGQEKCLRWSVFPVTGRTVACMVIATEVTQSVDEISNVIRARDQLRYAIDGADYGLWDWNVVTGEVYFSEKYMKILGYQQFELPHVYDTWTVLCMPDEVVDYEQAIADYEAVGDGFLEDEFQMFCKDGSLIWILSRGKVVSRRSDGTPLRIVGTHQDVSVQKEREKALVQAKEEAVKANQAKSDFLALISHEVRTPLNGITSVLELLADEDDAKERERLSQIALNSSDQLLTVLSDVLDVSKMEAGRFDLNPRPVNLADMIEELSQTHKKAIEAKGLFFNMVVNGDTEVSLMMDPVRVTQIMNNFLSNAAKFTEKGAVSLSVDIDKNYSAANNEEVYLSFAIRDDGVGLSPSERKELFQPFYQAEGTRSRSSDGTGLGLSICKKLATLMDGKVWCASKKGVGSTFYFEAAFPMLSDEIVVIDHEKSDVTESLDENIRILAAEDNPVNQIMLKKFLIDRLGYPVTIVSDGVQVLEALSHKEFDIILMDIHMPVLDGVAATQQIRASGKAWQNIPIIALTADAAQAHMDEYSLAGINACVSKPVNWQKLDQMVKSLAQVHASGKPNTIVPAN